MGQSLLKDPRVCGVWPTVPSHLQLHLTLVARFWSLSVQKILNFAPFLPKTYMENPELFHCDLYLWLFYNLDFLANYWQHKTARCLSPFRYSYDGQLWLKFLFLAKIGDLIMAW